MEEVCVKIGWKYKKSTSIKNTGSFRIFEVIDIIPHEESHEVIVIYKNSKSENFWCTLENFRKNFKYME